MVVVLGVDKKKKDYKLVGAYLSSWVHSYLTLYTLAKGNTKSNVLKELLETWISQQRTFYTDEELIQEIIQRIEIQWKLERKTNPLASFKKFKEDLRKEFLDKGVKDETVNIIIKEIE